MYWATGRRRRRGDPALIGLLFALLPGHLLDGRYSQLTARLLAAAARGPRLPLRQAKSYAKPYTETSYKGWLPSRRRRESFFQPALGRKTASSGMAVPFCFRTSADTRCTWGLHGHRRHGLTTYYAMTWNEGYGGTDWNVAGLPFFMLSWPGPAGLESSGPLSRPCSRASRMRVANLHRASSSSAKALPRTDLAKAAPGAVIESLPGVPHRGSFNFTPLAQNYIGWQDYSRKAYQACRGRGPEGRHPDV